VGPAAVEQNTVAQEGSAADGGAAGGEGERGELRAEEESTVAAAGSEAGRRRGACQPGGGCRERRGRRWSASREALDKERSAFNEERDGAFSPF
jgi:hypothetical protein